MAYIGLQNSAEPSSLKIRGRQATFTAKRPHAKRIEHRPEQLINHPGTEEHPHLRVIRLSNNTNNFFNQDNVTITSRGPFSRKFALGVFQKDGSGKVISAPQWFSLPRLKALRLSFSLFFRNLSLSSVIDQSVDGSKVVLTHCTGTYRTKVRGLSEEDTTRMHRYMEFYHHAEILESDGTKIMRVYYQPEIENAPLTSQDFDVTHIPLPELDSIYQNAENLPFSVTLESSDFDRETAKYNEDNTLVSIRPQYWIKFSTVERTLIGNPLGETPLPQDSKVTLTKVQSAIRVRHLDDHNGQAPDYEEWIPFNVKLPPFFYLHHYNPHHALPPQWGTGFRDGRKLMVLSAQVFAPGVSEDVYRNEALFTSLAQWWAKWDQLLFFLERQDDFYSWPYGLVANFKRPWWFSTRNAASILMGKSLAGDAICTGSNYVARAPWKDGLYPKEVIGFKHTFWGTLNHFNGITEDAQGAHEQVDFHDLVVEFVREVKAMAPTVQSHKQVALQRGRWLAMIGWFLSWGFHYLRDEIIRCRIFGLINATLGRLPLLGRVTRKLFPPIPSLFTYKKFWERINTGSWYDDSIAKKFIPLVPLLYVLGLTPLIAGPTFLVIWAVMTLLSYPSYVNLMRKTAMNPKHTFFPFPKFIFLWNLYVPGVARNVLHAEDVNTAKFAETAAEKTVKLSPGTKKFLFWYPILCTAGSLYGFFLLLWPMGLVTFGALAPVAGLLALGLCIRYTWSKWIANRILPPSVERTNPLHSLADFTVNEVLGFAAPIAISTYLMATNPFLYAALFSLGMFMNAVWGAFNGMGIGAAAQAYLVEQKWQRDEAVKELRKQVDSSELPLTPQQERFLFTNFTSLEEEAAALAALPADLQAICQKKKVSINFADDFSSFLYDGSGLDLIMPRRVYERAANVVRRIANIPARIARRIPRWALPVALAVTNASAGVKAQLYDPFIRTGSPTHQIQPPSGNEMENGVWLNHAPDPLHILCWENKYKQRVDIVYNFINFLHLRTDKPFPIKEADKLLEGGRVLFLAVEPWKGIGSPDLLERIADGHLDKELESFARGAAEYDGPVFASFAPEMNTGLYPWAGKPELFVRAYQRVYERVSRIAPNITWVWNPYLPALGEDITAYYPGDFVGRIAIDFFHRPGEPTDDLINRMDACLPELRRYEKPIMVGLYGSSARGKEKARFLTVIPGKFKEWGMKGSIYFNYSNPDENGASRNFMIDEKETAVAYTEALGRLDLKRNIVTGDGELEIESAKSPRKAAKTHIEALHQLDLEGDRVPPEICPEVEANFWGVSEHRQMIELKRLIKKLEYFLNDPHENNKVRLQLADAYRQLARLTPFKAERRSLIRNAFGHLRLALDSPDKTVQYHYRIGYVREYFELIINVTDLYLEDDKEQEVLPWLREIENDLSDRWTLLAHNISPESVPGYESRAELIRALTFERLGYRTAALQLYTLVDAWATEEQAKDPLTLKWSGEESSKIRFIAAKARLGMMRNALHPDSPLIPEAGNPDKPITPEIAKYVFKIANETFRWEELRTEKEGFMDLAFEKFIHVMDACMLLSNNNLDEAKKMFAEALAPSWEIINDDSPDLKKALGMKEPREAEVDLTDKNTDKWNEILKGLLRPDVRIEEKTLKFKLSELREFSGI